MSTLADNAVAELVLENKWKLLASEDNAQFPDKELTRFVPDVLEQDLEAVLRFMKRHTSAKNYRTAPDGSSAFVDKPMVNGKERDGVWYGGTLRWEYAPQNPQDGEGARKLMLFQVLRAGQHTVDYTLTESSCEFSVYTSWFHDLQSVPAVPANSTGVTYRLVSQSRNKDRGTFDVAIERRERKYQAASFTREDGALESTTRQIQEGLTTQTVPTVNGPDGTVMVQDQQLNPDCSKRVVTDTRTSKAVGPITDTHGGPLTVEATQVARHQLATPSPGAGADGTIEDVSPSINEFGRIDYVRNTRSAVAKGPISDTHGGPLAVEVTQVARNQVATPSPGAGAVGTIEDVSPSINEFGRVDYVRNTRTAVARGPVEDTHGGPLVSEVTALARNQVATPSPGAGSDGTIVDVSPSMNEFGKIDYVKNTRTAVGKGPISDTHGGPLAVEVTQVARNQVATPSPGAGAVGTIEDVSPSINEFGRVDYVRNTRTAVGRGPVEDTHGGPLAVEVTALARNQDAPPSPGAGADGTIVDVSPSMNEFGKIDYVKNTRRAVAKGPITDTHGGPLTVEVTRVARNQVATPSPGAGAAGTIEDVSPSINEFGRVDYVRNTRTAVPFDSGWVEWTDAGGTSAWRLFLNLPTPPKDGITAAYRVSGVPRYNDFGLWDGMYVRRPDESSGSSSAAAWNNYKETFTVKQLQTAVNDGVRQRRQATFNCGVKQTSSHTQAYAYINGKEGGNVDVFNGGRYFRATYAEFSSASGWQDDT